MEVVSSSGAIGGMDRPLGRGKRSSRLVAIGGILAALLAAASWVLLVPAQRTLRVAADKVSIGTVAAAPFHDFIPLRGQLVPLDSIVLDAVLGGRVEEVLVEAGQKVTEGQPLLRLSDPNLELDAIARETQVIEQINNQRALQLNFEQTRTADAKALADAEYNITRLGREVARRHPLAQMGYETQERSDQSADELAYQKRLREVAVDAQQRDTVVIARSEALIKETAGRLDENLAAAKRLLLALTVRAPADGILTSLDAHLGEEKARGQNLGQIDRDGGFKVSASIDEYYLTRVKPGQKVTVTVDGASAELTVAKVYPEVKSGKFEVDLVWTGTAPQGLRRGEAVEGKLELGSDTEAVILPAGPFLETSGGAWVFVVAPDGTSAQKRPVKLGRRTVDAVEVLSGLRPGDRVVTSDYAGLDRIDRLTLN